jgi:hypothetical protein
MARTADAPDVPPSTGALSRILQQLSPELVTGEANYLKGAVAGDIVLRFGDDRVAVKKFVCIPVAFDWTYAEYEPPQGSMRGQFVALHTSKPEDAEWRDAPDGRRAILRDNGNKIEEALNAYLVVDGKGVVFPFRSTAVKIGRQFADRAGRLHTSYHGEEIIGYAVGKWEVTSRLERSGDYRWYLPQVTLLGRLGEEGGPTLDEWRLASRARLAFKDGMDWSPESLPKLAPPPAEPQMNRRRRGEMHIESGSPKSEPVDEIPWS